MPQKQNILTTILSNLLIIIIAIALISCTVVFIKGQVDANHAIIDAGKAVLDSITSDSPIQAEIDYSAAISYLEAAQQAYTENSVIKIISLIYAVSSSIILGYGAKMLRLGASDKQELCEELLQKTEQQFSKVSDQILRHQNHVYTTVIACDNATQLSLLLISHFELSNNPSTTISSDIVGRLQVELMRSLQQCRNFLNYFKGKKDGNRLTKDQLDLINQSWAQTKRAIQEYICPQTGNNTSCLEKNFGKYDQKAAEDLVKEIKALLSFLNQ